MTLKGRLYRLLKHNQIIDEQYELLSLAARKLVEQEEGIHQIKLEHFREIQGLIVGWLISIESPEKDMRPSLVEMERDLGQQIAEIEEHVL